MTRVPITMHGRDHAHTGADPIHISWEDVGGGGGGGTSALSWCLALSGTLSVPNGTGSSTLFDFTGGLTTNDVAVYSLVTQGGGRKTPSIDTAGVYMIYMLAQGSIGSNTPAAGSGMVITPSTYGNEPIGNPTTGIFYVDPITSQGRVRAVWLWILGLDGGGSSSPVNGEIGVRQNSGFSCTTSISFSAVRIDQTGANIV